MGQYDGLLVTDPKQERARVTIDQILEGAHQVLDRDFGSELTTQKCADRAGFSIGTLYRYFPNKSAIIRALAQKEVVTCREQIDALLDEEQPLDPEKLVQGLVSVGIRFLEFSLKVRRQTASASLVDEGFSEWALGVLTKAIARSAKALATEYPSKFRTLSSVDKILLSGLLLGPIRLALVDERQDITDQTFQRELGNVVRTFLEVRD